MYIMERELRPILKWAGGKRRVFPEIKKRLPKNGFKRYFEPFIGGGYVLFALQPEKSFINDFNPELINVYKIIKNNPKELVKALSKFKNNSATFYKVREWDRNKKIFDSKSDIDKAARIIFLNKTCFNGLYRVNSNGELNVPFGDYKNPDYCNEELIFNMSDFFNNSEIDFSTGDFSSILSKVKKGDFVYLDPPYDPISDSASFTGYATCGFNRNDQKRLKEMCDEIDKKGAFFLLSNSATEFIKDLYNSNDNPNYITDIIKVNRAIASKSKSRKKVEEVLIRNYE